MHTRYVENDYTDIVAMKSNFIEQYILCEKRMIFKLLYFENKKLYRNKSKRILKLKVDSCSIYEMK